MTMEHGLDRFSHAGMKAGPVQAPAGSMSQGFVAGDLRRDTDNSAASRVARLAWFELAAAATRRSLAQDQAVALGLSEADVIDLGANPPRTASR
ncbi:hypothetical protein [Nitrospirillum iridis]|uniref:ABC-type hemin transport system ATPase subunit n=1 Tax=Nitrospirillum iridis TaxID=765888 RepID=A0A7X0AYY6_9PROT|nr:hypothetical protein [Nitrospirillum iridis]MBB6252668.1 ABC-type hemin transport system ATPase subunit [Nitrospirillum iridis]